MTSTFSDVGPIRRARCFGAVNQKRHHGLGRRIQDNPVAMSQLAKLGCVVCGSVLMPKPRALLNLNARRFHATGFGLPLPAQNRPLQGLKFRFNDAVEQRIFSIV